MAMFAPFNKATKRDPLRMAEAVAQQGQMEQQAKAQENSQRSQNLIGGGMLYNYGMGDSSPIADYLRSLGGAEAPLTDAGGVSLAEQEAINSAAKMEGAGGGALNQNFGLSNGMTPAEMSAMETSIGMEGAGGGAMVQPTTAAATTAVAPTTAATPAVAPVGAGSTGALAGASNLGPYGAALAATLYADQELLDGQVLKANEDVWGGAVGKGWLWGDKWWS